jgi:thiamine kinase-like enzyme
MELDVQNEARAAAILDRVPGWAGRTRTIEPLGGGITNRNFRVTVDGEVYVLRIPAESGGLLGIDRQIEHEASELAADAGVGPQVVAFLEPEGALVTRFIEGQPVSETAVHQPAVIERIAESLRRVHRAGTIRATFSPFRIGETYATTTRQRGGSVPPAYDRAQSIATTIERSLPLEPAVFCHNDLLNANFIDDGTQVRIVDWEYAGMGDRFFDFGNFAVNHQLIEDEEHWLLAAYFGSVTPAQTARLRLMRLASDFREAMWGVLQTAISSLDFDFRAYAQKHFDRMLAGAADRRYSQWLRQAGS